MFEYEKLEAFGLALEFVDRAARIADRMPPAWRHMADQLRRASTSVPFNLAEGAGEYSRAEKQRIYRISRRSLEECSAIIATAERVCVRGKDVAEVQEIGRRLNSMLLALGGSRRTGRPREPGSAPSSGPAVPATRVPAAPPVPP